jgi:hypothetical protein
MNKHRVKTHHWENGILSVIDHFFEELEEALLFANNVDSHGAKVYDNNHSLVHHVASGVVPDEINSRESYA